MTKTPLIVCCALLVLLARPVGASSAKPPRATTVELKLVTTVGDASEDVPICKKDQVFSAAEPCGPDAQPPPAKTTIESFSLTCNPTGGTLPLADRVCADISGHPATMLDPTVLPGSVQNLHHLCGFIPGYSRYLEVRATSNGIVTGFRSSGSYCGQPNDPTFDAFAIYSAAIAGNEPALAALEPGLDCINHRSVLCIPGIKAGVIRAIGAAEPAPELNPIRRVDSLFPMEIGTQRCSIRVGKASSKRWLIGDCSSDVQGLVAATSTPTVVFTEAWPVGPHETASHSWSVRLERYAVVAVAQSGSQPPQLWRGPKANSVPARADAPQPSG